MQILMNHLGICCKFVNKPGRFHQLDYTPIQMVQDNSHYLGLLLLFLKVFHRKCYNSIDFTTALNAGAATTHKIY